MALRINLYHEVIRAKRQKQYDPLKLSMLGLGVVAVAMAGVYVVQLKRTSDIRSAFSAQKDEFERLSPQQKAAEKKEVELNKQIDLAERFSKRMEKRIYWAPLFETVMGAVPPNVQITRLVCDSGREKAGAGQMNIEGIAADPEPRNVAENLRKAVAERIGAKYPNATATFRNLDDSTEHPVVNGKRVPAVVFSINVTFKTEADAPAPAVPVKRTPKNEVATL
jgi:Tfp pilus assembly protein PilN